MENQEAEFIQKLAGILEISDVPNPGSVELGRDSWDSLAILGAIAAIDEYYGITISAKSISECASIQEVLELVKESAGNLE